MQIRCPIQHHSPDSIVVRPEGVDIFDEATAKVFYETMHHIFKTALRGRRVWILADISKVKISPAGAKFYGPYMKQIEQEFTYGIIRFGAPEGLTKMAMLTQGILQNYAANVFNDLEGAEGMLARLRADRQQKASSSPTANAR
jgi:hypothetical protein